MSVLILVAKEVGFSWNGANDQTKPLERVSVLQQPLQFRIMTEAKLSQDERLELGNNVFSMPTVGQ